MTDPTKTGGYKFVRVGGEYRFCDDFLSHSSLVKDGEKAESAGWIFVYKSCWTFGSFNYSSVLRVGTDSSDAENLTKIIGLPFEERT